MLSRYFYSKILVILAFGFLNVGLVSAQTDDLSGVWVTSITDITKTTKQMEMTFDNGNFEVKLDDVFFSKGTYSAAGGKYTTQATSFYGTSFQLNSRWYSQEQLRSALKSSFLKIMEADRFNAIIDSMFVSRTGAYTIKGNTLTMKNDGEKDALTYTKK